VLTVERALGHTIGSYKVLLRSEGQQGMFSGDVIHHPVQLVKPDPCSTFDEDEGGACKRDAPAHAGGLRGT